MAMLWLCPHGALPLSQLHSDSQARAQSPSLHTFTNVHSMVYSTGGGGGGGLSRPGGCLRGGLERLGYLDEQHPAPEILTLKKKKKIKVVLLTSAVNYSHNTSYA